MKLFILLFLSSISYAGITNPGSYIQNGSSFNILSTGQTTMANSLPMTLASDQSAIPVSQSGLWTNACTQSGTWTVQQGTPPWSVVGNIASGSADSGSPIKIGGIYNSTLPTFTTGQRGDVQLSPKGAILVAGANAVGVAPADNPVTIAGVDGGGLKRYLLTDTSGNTGVIGSVASGASDSGNPVKVGGKYNATLPTLSDGNRGDMQIDSFGRIIVSMVNKYANLTGAATTTVKSGAGYLHTVCFDNATTASVVTIYDNTTATAPIIATITAATGTSGQAFCQIYDVIFNTGLTISRTVTGTNITVSYQ